MYKVLTRTILVLINNNSLYYSLDMCLCNCIVWQQWRLIPYVAAAYATEVFTMSLFMDFVGFHAGTIMGEKGDQQVGWNDGSVVSCL